MLFKLFSAIGKKYIDNYDELFDFKLGPFNVTYFMILELTLICSIPALQIFQSSLRLSITKLVPVFLTLSLFLADPILSKFEFTLNYDLLNNLSQLYVMLLFVTESCFYFVLLIKDRRRGKFKKIVTNILLALDLFELFIRFYKLYYFFRGAHKWKSLAINSLFHAVYYFGRVIFDTNYQKYLYLKSNDNNKIEKLNPSNALIRDQTYLISHFSFAFIYFNLLKSCNDKNELDKVVIISFYIMAIGTRTMFRNFRASPSFVDRQIEKYSSNIQEKRFR